MIDNGENQGRKELQKWRDIRNKMLRFAARLVMRHNGEADIRDKVID